MPRAKSFCSVVAAPAARERVSVCDALRRTAPKRTMGVLRGTTAWRKRMGALGESQMPSRLASDSVKPGAPVFSQLAGALTEAASAAATSGCGVAASSPSVIGREPDLLSDQKRNYTET